MATPSDRPSGSEPDPLHEEDLRLLKLLQRIEANLIDDPSERVIPFPEQAAQPKKPASRPTHDRALLTRLLKGLRDDDGDEDDGKDDEQPRKAA